MVKKQGPGGVGKSKNEPINSYEPTAEFKEPEKPPYFLCALP